jgi:hypothetical protein
LEERLIAAHLRCERSGQQKKETGVAEPIDECLDGRLDGSAAGPVRELFPTHPTVNERALAVDTTRPDGPKTVGTRVKGAINVARAFLGGRIDRGRDDRGQARKGRSEEAGRRSGVGQRR